jgi:hypothetical protein
VNLNPSKPSVYTALFFMHEACLWNPSNTTLLQVLIEGGWIVSHFDLVITEIEEGNYFLY